MFHYEPLQSEKGQQILNEKNITERNTVIFLYENSIYTRSDAFVEMVQLLPFPWNWLRFIKYFPKKWRDNIYDFIARNRFHWFGRNKFCSVN
jgi:predicted DCC family thiol-disulfide oxidoreductase YuxK